MPNIDSAQILPMKATPKADIGIAATAVEPATPIAASGILISEPMMPTPKPTPISTALRPPSSPALIASAAATPGGQAAVAGKTRESNIR